MSGKLYVVNPQSSWILLFKLTLYMRRTDRLGEGPPGSKTVVYPMTEQNFFLYLRQMKEIQAQKHSTHEYKDTIFVFKEHTQSGYLRGL